MKLFKLLQSVWLQWNIAFSILLICFFIAAIVRMGADRMIIGFIGLAALLTLWLNLYIGRAKGEVKMDKNKDVEHEIKFCKNWNGKLDNKVFTTIRRSEGQKQAYYRHCLGETFNVLLEGAEYDKAKLVDVKVVKFCDIPPFVLACDTGETDVSRIKSIFQEFGLRSAQDEMLILTFATICSD